TRLTVTDANLLLGRLDPDAFLGGRMRLDVARTAEIAADTARQLKLGVSALAEGIVRVANANMERAIRVVSVERGHDPRRFALVAFGGAGGMHACEIARELDISTVMVPRHAGVLSALGMLLADVTRDYSASVLTAVHDLGARDLDRRFAPLVRQAVRDLRAEGFGEARQAIARLVDVRYVGQSYEITLPYTPRFRDEFDRRHGKTYGYSNPQRPAEVVNIRVHATGVTEKPPLPKARALRRSTPKPSGVRPGRFGGRDVRVSFYRWADLPVGSAGAGPAVISGGEATVVVPPRFQFEIDRFGNVILKGAARS
ncbi:MAG TPA: hydantoinase/oxoprolinase family protein, partial [Vicinamibacterales bacterium]|nr:hydantoinase/oxoprolinase family protein [Vicinamibacterales bacterium]